MVRSIPFVLVLTIAVAMIAAPAHSDEAVHVWITSPQETPTDPPAEIPGSIELPEPVPVTVRPGDWVSWSIFVRAGSGSHGLSMFAADLEQDPGNPELFDIPPGERAPESMTAFDRPAGFTNPASDPWGSGYGGTPVPNGAGAHNLVQIGGAQNTFGTAGPCLGPAEDICLGQSVDVVRHIGQSRAGQLVATGGFAAPATPGLYSFSLANVRVNTLLNVNASPARSRVRSADPELVKSLFSIRVDAGTGEE